MKKIMFNDRYGLTQAVLDGRKTMTRRIIPDIWIDFPRSGRQKAVIAGLDSQVLMMDLSHVLGENCLYSADRKYQPKYYKGDEVAVAMSYKSIIDAAKHDDYVRRFLVSKELMQEDDTVLVDLYTSAGYDNKMFAKADFMPHRIRITDIKVARLQDISEDDCMKEGIFKNSCCMPYGYHNGDGITKCYPTPIDAFSVLIDRISGRGTWERNPWVYAYEFELIK